MKTISFLFVFLTIISSVFAVEFEVGNKAKVTPLVDALVVEQYLSGGTKNYGDNSYQVVEIGGRYDYVGDMDMFGTFTITNGESKITTGDTDKEIMLGDLNVGVAKNNHTFMVGRGKYPIGIILSNNNFNQRKELWAPISMSVFLTNIIGEHQDAVFYQYSNNIKDINYKCKTILTKNKFNLHGTYGDEGTEKTIPIFSLETNYKRFTNELSYSSAYDNRAYTIIEGIKLDLPKSIVLEVEYLKHRRTNGIMYSAVGAKDEEVIKHFATFGITDVYSFLDNLSYESIQVILEKTHSLFGKQITYFTHYYTSRTSMNMIFAAKPITITMPDQKFSYSTNWQWRIGAAINLNEEIIWTTEYEKNNIQALPEWDARYSTGLRLRF